MTVTYVHVDSKASVTM